MRRTMWLVLMTTAVGALAVSLSATPVAGREQARRDPGKAYGGGGSQQQPQLPQEVKQGKPRADNRPADFRDKGWKVPAVGEEARHNNPPRDKPPRDDRPRDNRPRGHHGDRDHGYRPDRPPLHRPGYGYGSVYRPMPYYWSMPGYYGYYSSPYDWAFPRYWDYPRTWDEGDDWSDDDPSTPPASQLLERIVGAEIWAADGVFLGVIDPDPKPDDSICNPAGPHGSFDSPTSILNPRGEYGAGRGPLSCWDPDTRTPPRLFWHGRFVGYLTANPSLDPRTDPAWILHHWLGDRD